MLERCEQMIECIIFDFGRVLGLDQQEVNISNMARLAGMDLEDLRTRYFKFRGPYDEGIIGTKTYWEQITEVSQVELTEELIDQLRLEDSYSWTSMNQQMVGLVSEVKALGYKTAILSNINDGVLSYIREHFNWLATFDYEFYSCEMKLIKPGKAIYDKVIEEIGVSAEACFFIDDTPANIDGAKSVGMAGLVFESYEQVKAAIGL